MEHSKVITSMKELQGWRFVLLWVWLMTLGLAPIALAIAWALK